MQTDNDKQLTDAVLKAAEELTKSIDKAVCAGLRVKLSLAVHSRIPGPSCDAVAVTVERVDWEKRYSPCAIKESLFCGYINDPI